jgi:hypothetical protein
MGRLSSAIVEFAATDQVRVDLLQVTARVGHVVLDQRYDSGSTLS